MTKWERLLQSALLGKGISSLFFPSKIKMRAALLSLSCFSCLKRNQSEENREEETGAAEFVDNNGATTATVVSTKVNVLHFCSCGGFLRIYALT